VGIANTQLKFEFRVFEGTYEAVDTVAVTVDVDNGKPTAYAGEDQAVASGVTVQLEGSGGLSYFWVQIDGPTVQLSSDTSANPTFTAPSLSTADTVEFETQVSSGPFMSIDTVVIHVAPASTTETSTQGSSNEEADSQTPEWARPYTDWLTSPDVALGLGLMFLALLLIWIFFL
jgi:hypothetical protein